MTPLHLQKLSDFASFARSLQLVVQRGPVAVGENLWFFLKWIASPLRIGAPLSSGQSLASAIAQAVDPTRPGFVVELGAGSGAITQALLLRGVPRDRLVVIEQDKQFFELLEGRFPGVQIVHGNAVDLCQILGDVPGEAVNALISGLPLLFMPAPLRQRILSQGFELIADGGVLLQFSYGPGSPVPASLLRTHGMTGKQVARVWRNLPPARVWRYERAVHGEREASRRSG